MAVIHLDVAHIEKPAWDFTAEQLRELIDRGCIKCGAQTEPEPTAAERQRILDDLDFHWGSPDGEYLYVGFGLMGGGYGPYVHCGRCGFFGKRDLGPEVT